MPQRDSYSLRAAFGPIPEESSARITGILVDEDGVALTALDTITATLFDRCSVRILNARNRQDVLNVNGGTFDPATGRFTLLLSPAANLIINQGRWIEEHMVRFDFTFTPAGSTQRTGRWAAVLRLSNLEQLNEGL